MINMPPALNAPNGAPNNMEMGITQNMSESQKILAHVSPDEIPYLNEMQGEEIIDPETGLRDYSGKLNMILQSPEGQALLLQAKEMIGQKHMAEGGMAEQEGRPIAPELEELRLEGRGKDTELIIITPELEEIFYELHDGKVDINPVTGFPEYGFFKEFLRAAGTIMGPVSGFIASKATGQSTGAALKNAGIGAGLSLAAMGGANPLSFIPGMPGGSGGPGGFNPLSFLTGGAGRNSVGMNTAGQMMPDQQQIGGPTGSGGFNTIGGQQGGSGFLQSLLSNPVLPLAGSAIMGYMGHKDEEKRKKAYDMRQLEEANRVRAKGNEPYHKPKPYSIEPLGVSLTPEEIAAGKEQKWFNHPPLDKIEYEAHGGLIRGMGKGQDDKIPRKLPENSYILDASTVSDIGDGSTDAGYKQLNTFFSKIPNQPMHQAKGGYINALLSDGEYEIPPEKVASLGGGSSQKGAKILEDMVKKLRSKKRTSGEKLPPKTKNLGGYLSQIKRA